MKQDQIPDLKSTGLEFVNKAKMSNPVESATAWVAADLLKALVILPYTTVRRSAVDREDPKSNWKLEKRPHCLMRSTNLLFISFSKILLTTERWLTGW